MSIHINKARKQYFICYKTYDEIDGKYKTITVTNAKWTLEKGLKYMKSIEQEVVLEDKRKRKLRLSKGRDLTLEDLINLYDKTLELNFKNQSCYNKRLIISKYINKQFNIEKDLNNALTVQSIERFKNKVLEYNLGYKRVNEIFKLLKDILDYAAERDYLTYELSNKFKTILKNVKSKGKVQEKLCFWTNEEWDSFINSFDEKDKFKLLFEVDYKCALRLGELLALKWNDFNSDKKTILVDESYDNLGNITTPKNVSSNATVSLSSELVEKLIEFKKETCGDEDDFIFFPDKHTSRTTIRRVMEKHITMSGVPYIKFHGLRHSCASRMINAGCSPLIVSKHLRHSSTQQTLDTYAHLFPNETIGLMDKIF